MSTELDFNAAPWSSGNINHDADSLPDSSGDDNEEPPVVVASAHGVEEENTVFRSMNRLSLSSNVSHLWDASTVSEHSNAKYSNRVQQELEVLRSKHLAKNQRDRLKDRK
jgi:hypothetical protein